MRDLANINSVFEGSNGDVTKAMYDELMAMGPAGVVAVNLFRSHKNSVRAKRYKRRSSTHAAYDTKDWALNNLCECLDRHGATLGILWGWGRDERAVNFENVLYVDLPTGQVSFHLARRIKGPDYPGEWDGQRNASTGRLCQWIADLFAARAEARAA